MKLPRLSLTRDRIVTLLLCLLVLAGLSLLLYPTVSDRWNSLHQTRAIESYAVQVAGLDEAEADRIWQAARRYNAALAARPVQSALTEEQLADYAAQLDPDGTGVMGSLEIPRIRCTLPIYHGTDEATLQVAVGHLNWTSLPVGGAGSHCVLSGHRGLPSARLFTDLPELEVGDRFYLHILDRTLTYQVDQILTVAPQDTTALRIEQGKDYCTLVTCTPYGINTHRLLVRGCRVDGQDQTAENAARSAPQAQALSANPERGEADETL